MELRFGQLQPLAFVLLFAFAGGGCGRSNKVYPDRSSVAGDTVSVDGRNLPKNFVNQSANLGEVTLTSANEIELKTLAGESAEGAFDGSGKGSLAVLGLTAFDQTRLSEFSTFSVEIKRTFGHAPVSAFLIVDLECDSSSPQLRTLIAENLEVADFTALDLSTKAAVWKIKGADLKNSQDELVVSSTVNGTLEPLLASHPNACLRNNVNSDAMNDGNLPKLPTTGVLLTLGSPTTVDQNHVLVRRIEIGTKVFDSANWGS